jgi:hypothetical protein
MHFESFLDYIHSQGCQPLVEFDTPFETIYQSIHNLSRLGTLHKEDYWIRREAVILFCFEIGIDVPPEIQGGIEEYNEYGI